MQGVPSNAWAPDFFAEKKINLFFFFFFKKSSCEAAGGVDPCERGGETFVFLPAALRAEANKRTRSCSTGALASACRKPELRRSSSGAPVERQRQPLRSTCGAPLRWGLGPQPLRVDAPPQERQPPSAPLIRRSGAPPRRRQLRNARFEGARLRVRLRENTAEGGPPLGQCRFARREEL